MHAKSRSGGSVSTTSRAASTDTARSASARCHPTTTLRCNMAECARMGSRAPRASSTPTVAGVAPARRAPRRARVPTAYLAVPARPGRRAARANATPGSAPLPSMAKPAPRIRSAPRGSAFTGGSRISVARTVPTTTRAAATKTVATVPACTSAAPASTASSAVRTGASGPGATRACSVRAACARTVSARRLAGSARAAIERRHARADIAETVNARPAQLARAATRIVPRLTSASRACCAYRASAATAQVGVRARRLPTARLRIASTTSAPRARLASRVSSQPIALLGSSAGSGPATSAMWEILASSMWTASIARVTIRRAPRPARAVWRPEDAPAAMIATACGTTASPARARAVAPAPRV